MKNVKNNFWNLRIIFFLNIYLLNFIPQQRNDDATSVMDSKFSKKINEIGLIFRLDSKLLKCEKISDHFSELKSGWDKLLAIIVDGTRKNFGMWARSGVLRDNLTFSSKTYLCSLANIFQGIFCFCWEFLQRVFEADNENKIS